MQRLRRLLPRRTLSRQPFPAQAPARGLPQRDRRSAAGFRQAAAATPISSLSKMIEGRSKSRRWRDGSEPVSLGGRRLAADNSFGVVRWLKYFSKIAAGY